MRDVGLLLFSLFVSDIPDLLENYIYMFADDTKIYQAILDDQKAQHITCKKTSTICNHSQ